MNPTNNAFVQIAASITASQEHLQRSEALMSILAAQIRAEAQDLKNLRRELDQLHLLPPAPSPGPRARC